MTESQTNPHDCSAWENRIALAQDGWITNVRINDHGIGKDRETHLSVGLWAKTSNWAGWITEVSLHKTSLVPRNADLIAEEIQRLSAVMREGCTTARQAFPETIPCLDHSASTRDSLAFVTNSYAMTHTQGQARNHFPTEAIHPGAGMGNSDAHAYAIARAVMNGMHVDDSLDPFADRYRLLSDCKNRNWQYGLRLCMRKWGNLTPAHQPARFSTNILEQTVTASLVKSAAASLWDLFAEFGPNGIRSGETENSLPPGFQTRQEKLDADRVARLAYEAEHGPLDDPYDTP